MVIEISFPNKIYPKKFCKENKQDFHIKELLFLEQETLVKDILNGTNVKGIITIKKDDILTIGYKGKVNVGEYLLRLIFKKVEKKTGIDIEDLIKAAQLEIK